MMFGIGKKWRVGFFMIICVMMVAAPAFGQVGADESPTAVFGREPPLTQNDIDAYLAAFPHLKNTGESQNEVARVYERAGLSQERSIYVVVKIAHASAVIQFEKELGAGAAESYRDSLDENLRPSIEEVELVRKNTPKLEAAMEAMAAW